MPELKDSPTRIARGIQHFSRIYTDIIPFILSLDYLRLEVVNKRGDVVQVVVYIVLLQERHWVIPVVVNLVDA